jgi:glucosamine--fructose-6-phosphate aminotransferase (isomerizing)
LYAGREVGVASTKAYVTQIIGLHLLSLFFSDGDITDDYLSLSNQIKIILKRYFPFLKKDGKNIFVCSKELMPIIQSLDKQNHGFTLSSGSLRATSYEGSLKIKEVGRIFIQGYPTSSLKHGPFSLIEEGIPIIFTLQKGDEDVLRRTNSAIEEVHLRGAKIYVITDIEDYENEKVDEMIKIPHNKTFSSILSIIPFQILSYYVAGFRGFDCDRPINLAKCVTTD